MLYSTLKPGGKMKVAFISDIHSNPMALEAVLKDIESRQIDSIYNLGDSIGYHTKPNEVLQLLQEKELTSIKGNHDLDILNKKFNPKNDPDIFEWTFNNLTEENCQYLESLPDSINVTIEGWKFHICHGSPESVELYCYEGSDYSEEMINASEADVIVCGHTHLPYLKKYDKKYMINSGSVGKPKIGRPNATYNLVTVTETDISSEIIEVPYDYESMASHVESFGFGKYATHLRTGIVK